jgi:hypothetical protein
MKIDPGSNFLAPVSRPQSAASAKGVAAFADLMTSVAARAAHPDAAKAGNGDRPDFTSMTRKDMFDWMNGKIKSGAMSLDDSSAFLGMTLKIPVGTGQGAPSGPDDREQVDFTRLAQDGIAGALSRNDSVTRTMLEAAMQTMRQYQGGGVDLRG